MEDSLEEFAKSMQEKANCGYSEVTKDHAMNPRNVGRVENADGFSNITGPCGDTMEISIKIEDEKISEAMFWTDGCGSSIAAGSMTTELAKGKTVKESLEINQLEVLHALGGLPRENVHCALLSSNTLHAAIEDYQSRKHR